MQCPACTAELPEDDVFCEDCGARLSAPPPAHPAAAAGGCACGAPAGEVDEDNFCLRCGRRVRVPLEWDHVEQPFSPDFAAVTDRGFRHDRNEDRCAIAHSGDIFAMVVCDGVSSSHLSEFASSAVAQGTLEALIHTPTPEAAADPEAAMRSAIVAGAAALVSQSPHGPDDNPPSTTVVAALVIGAEAIIGWMGDSRAYWIDASGAKPLTRDHSWMNDVAAAAGLTPEQAAGSPNAHAITRWIGADSTGVPDPTIVRHPLAGPGILLLCTDGLWNYAETNDVMTKVVHDASSAGQTAVEIARNLVQFANDQGGTDNITAAVLRVEPTPPAAKID